MAGGLDIRPRVVLHTSAGAVVILVDPKTPLSGTTTFPLVGNVPYDVVLDYPTSNIVLHFPLWGDVPVPIDMASLGTGGGGGSVDLPALGPTPYEVVLGDPGIPAANLATPGGLLAAFAGKGTLLLLAGAGVWLLWGRRR